MAVEWIDKDGLIQALRSEIEEAQRNGLTPTTDAYVQGLGAAIAIVVTRAATPEPPTPESEK